MDDVSNIENTIVWGIAISLIIGIILMLYTGKPLLLGLGVLTAIVWSIVMDRKKRKTKKRIDHVVK